MKVISGLCFVGESGGSVNFGTCGVQRSTLSTRHRPCLVLPHLNRVEYRLIRRYDDWSHRLDCQYSTRISRTIRRRANRRDNSDQNK